MSKASPFPHDIVDPVELRERLLAALSAQDDSARKVLTQELKQVLKDGRTQIAQMLEADPHNARPVVSAYAWLTDCVVQVAFDIMANTVYPLQVPTKGERLALLAVGGSGRGEMAPHSDVDLLFLVPHKVTPWAENVIESLLYVLWDLRLKVGHACRSVNETLRLAKEDHTICTALVEHRFLQGDQALADELDHRLRTELFTKTAREFTEAKLEERATRHEKQGDNRYVVEPNVKEGKGGLRDLQSLYWIGKYVHGVKHAADLVACGVFTPDEFQTFRDAENFLWAVRCHLHLLTNRPADQLTFDLQVEVADRMGYKAHDGRRAVEYFMQDYFRHAVKVGDLTRIFLSALEEMHVKKPPLLDGLFKRRKRLKAGYELRYNRLAVADETAFLGDPLNLLRIFEEGLRTGYLIHHDAMRMVAQNLHLIDDQMRKSPEAIRIFSDLLLKHGNPERALRRMNELGVLAAFIPEFEPIVAMMQFNMYHSYTVDEHTIQTINHLARIERGELEEELPIASSILAKGVNRKVLYIALLLHDIGKGRDEDHAVLGARIARQVTPRLGLKKDECKTVEWLVRYHLLMSDMAQKRDIADPRTVRDFAKAVTSIDRLDLLTVLTVCDISGVGPGVWNNWKAVLIRALYRQTANALENGFEALTRNNRGDEAKKNLRNALSDWPAKDMRVETSRHYPPYWQGLHVTAHVIFANLLRDLNDNEIRMDLQPDEDRDATRACFALADHPGLFSRMTGALTLVGANIVDARTFTSKDGYATAVFWVQDADGHPFAADRLPRMQEMIGKTLRGEVLARDMIQSRDKIKKRERAFKVPTSITFDNEGSEIYTIIEVDTRDRLGLLYDLTRTLAHANINIASAVIATYGEQVVDTFYVKDMFGHKLHAQGKRDRLEQKLREAIAEGAQRALS